MSPLRFALPALTLAAAFGAGTLAAASGQDTATRAALAQTARVAGAPDRTLSLSRVTIPAGARLALHRHTGTQVAYVAEGTLTYTVTRGSVTVRRGAADADPQVVRVIRAGRPGRIQANEWLVEQPSAVHRAANRGERPVVVYLATLLPHGDPPSVPAG